MSAELAVVDTVNRFHLYVDRRDWPSARDCLADQVQVSLGGTGGQGLPADRFLGMIRSNVESFAATQHLVIGHHIHLDSDTTASCAANYVNHHVSKLGGWLTAGQADYRLRRYPGGWQIDAVTLRQAREEGSRPGPAAA
jgi:hypothetical protein